MITPKKAKEFHSMEEFEKKYYPEKFKKTSIEAVDPNALGTVLAKESLAKFKHLIQKRKISI